MLSLSDAENTRPERTSDISAPGRCECVEQPVTLISPQLNILKSAWRSQTDTPLPAHNGQMFFIPKRENYCRLTNRSPTRNSRMEHETSSSSPPPGMMSHQRNSRMESEPWAVGMRKAKGSAGLSLFASETCSIRGVFFAEANVNGFGWGVVK